MKKILESGSAKGISGELIKKIASGRENIFPSTGYLLPLLKNSNIGQRRRHS